MSTSHVQRPPRPDLDPDFANEDTYSPGDTTPMREEVRMVVLSLAIGLLLGLVVVWFRMAIDGARLIFLKSWLGSRGPLIIFVPAFGGLAAALLLQQFFHYVRGGGINETIAALSLNNGYVSLRTAIGNFIGSALAIGSGDPLGPEDPALHIGTGLASFLGRRMRLSREQLNRLAPVGAAAGIAGALNAPIAAVLFVIEVVIGSWNAATLGSVVLAVVASVIVVRYFLGASPVFHLGAIYVGGPREVLGYIILGVVGGFASLALARSIQEVRAQVIRLPQWTYCLQVGIAGLAVGAIAYIGFPQILGTGYGVVSQATAGQFGWKLLLGLTALKLLATVLSFATRTPGGIIAPILFIGAMLGCATSGIAHSFAVHGTASGSAYALIGMAVLVTGVLRAPLTALMLVVELAGSYWIIIPAMIAISIAYLLGRRLQPHSLLELLRIQDGMRLPRIEVQKPEAALRVQDAMQEPSFPVVDSSLTLRQAWRDVVDRPGELIFVRHADEGWTVIDRAVLDQLEAVSDPQQRLKDNMDASRMPQLYPDLPLDTTLRHLHRWPVLPVVSRANVRTLAGIITMDAVMARYQSQLPR